MKPQALVLVASLCLSTYACATGLGYGGRINDRSPNPQPPSFDLAHAGKRATVAFAMPKIPTKVTWEEPLGHTSEDVTVEQKLDFDANDPCVFHYVLKRTVEGPTFDQHTSDETGSFASDTVVPIEGKSNEELPPGGEFLIHFEGRGSLQLDFDRAQDRQTVFGALQHLVSLCRVLPEPD
jgi:hypothetical protein